MSRPVTLQTLIDRTKQRANVVVASSSALNPQTEIIDNINEGIAELYDLILECQPQDFYLNSVTFQTSSTTDTYSIGANGYIPIQDFYRFRGLDINWGNAQIATALPFMWRERNKYKWLPPGWLSSKPVFYRMIGNALKLIPTPAGAFTCTLWYSPIAPLLVNTTDTFDGFNGHEEYAVLHAAIKLLSKQERFEHMGVLAQMKAEISGRILTMLGNRDAENPERVQDVTMTDGTSWRPWC